MEETVNTVTGEVIAEVFSAEELHNLILTDRIKTSVMFDKQKGSYRCKIYSNNLYDNSLNKSFLEKLNRTFDTIKSFKFNVNKQIVEVPLEKDFKYIEDPDGTVNFPGNTRSYKVKQVDNLALQLLTGHYCLQA